MKRMIVFALLGPLLGMLEIAPLTLPAVGRPGNLFGEIALMLKAAYVYGTVPALLTCAADWFLASRMQAWPRVLATALCGFTFSASSGYFMLKSTSPFVMALAFGLIGIIPAAICSWLSDERNGEAR